MKRKIKEELTDSVIGRAEMNLKKKTKLTRDRKKFFDPDIEDQQYCQLQSVEHKNKLWWLGCNTIPIDVQASHGD